MTLSIDPARIKALVLDVDGTLYRQAGLRRAMLWRLVQGHLACPLRGFSTIRILRAYRRAQESLRQCSPSQIDIADRQLQLASEWTGVAPDLVGTCVARWMDQEPIGVLPPFIYPGLTTFLRRAKDSGIRVAALSDYDPARKIEALGLRPLFDVIASAQDRDIQAFKPDPRGLEVVLRRLEVSKNEVLYIGDRPEVDGAAAAAAGIACVIVGRKVGRKTIQHQRWIGIETYRELTHALHNS